MDGHLLLLLQASLLRNGKFLAEFANGLVAVRHFLDGLLPSLQHHLSLLMKHVEILRYTIKLCLFRLYVGYHRIQFAPFSVEVVRQLFLAQSQLLDLKLIATLILLEGQLIIALLLCCQRPLLEFLLVPIHLHLEFVQLLVTSEDLVLHIVEPTLYTLEFAVNALRLNLVTTKTTTRQLLEVLLGVNLLQFGTLQGIGML